jgi:hypothetical protein
MQILPQKKKICRNYVFVSKLVLNYAMSSEKHLPSHKMPPHSTQKHNLVCVYICVCIYRMPQEECARLPNKKELMRTKVETNESSVAQSVRLTVRFSVHFV